MKHWPILGWALLLVQTAGVASDQSVLNVTTRLVEVQVVVSDHHGQPVTGLTRDDFILKDRGQIQKITSFSVEDEPAPPETPPATAALSPGVVSNLGRPDQAVANSVSVILLDKLNTRLSEQRAVRQKILDYLQKAELRGRIAILALTEKGNLKVLADFTTDSHKLQTAAASDRPWISQLQRMSEMDIMDSGDVLADSGELGTPGHVPDSTRKQAQFGNELRIRSTLRAMEWIGRALGHVPGRKNLVWFSDAFPLNMGYEPESIMNLRVEHLDFEPAIAKTMRVLTDANVAVYPVDTRGLSGVAMADASQQNELYGDPLAATSGTSIAPSVMQARVSMQTMAKMTGGKAFFERNDLGEALRVAFADSRVVYVLGYQPTHEQWDGKFRPIEVRVKQQGVTVRHRGGYFAVAEEAEPQRQASLLRAVGSPLDATGIGLLGSVAREENQWKLTLIASAQNLSLTPANGVWTGMLDVLFVQEDANGKRLDAKEVAVPLNWTADLLEDKLQHGARFNRRLDVLPGAVRLRVVVLDRTSSRMGSLTIPLN